MPLDNSHILTNEAQIRERARATMLRHGQRLEMVLRRIAGNEGAALAMAARDIIAADDMQPAAWPLDEIHGLLARPGQPQDRQVERLLGVIDSLRQNVDRLADPLPDWPKRKVGTDSPAARQEAA